MIQWFVKKCHCSISALVLHLLVIALLILYIGSVEKLCFQEYISIFEYNPVTSGCILLWELNFNVIEYLLH